MVTFAMGNNERYPGLDEQGSIIPGDASIWTVNGSPASGGHPATRLALLVQGGQISRELLISPADAHTTWPENDETLSNITTENYSYAMLRLQQNQDAGDAADPESLKDQAFGDLPNEWRDTINTEAAVLSDRNLGPDADAGAHSLHSNDDSQWHGSVGWNDNHVTFESTHVLPTKWTNGQEMIINQTPIDNLFSDHEQAAAPEVGLAARPSNGRLGNSAVAAKAPAGTQGQAAMVHDDHWSYINHGNN
ncbi:MAG: hypothetical protein RIG82_06645 [Phycisphaeraceae bacterium]